MLCLKPCQEKKKKSTAGQPPATKPGWLGRCIPTKMPHTSQGTGVVLGQEDGVSLCTHLPPIQQRCFVTICYFCICKPSSQFPARSLNEINSELHKKSNLNPSVLIIQKLPFPPQVTSSCPGFLQHPVLRI